MTDVTFEDLNIDSLYPDDVNLDMKVDQSESDDDYINRYDVSDVDSTVVSLNKLMNSISGVDTYFNTLQTYGSHPTLHSFVGNKITTLVGNASYDILATQMSSLNYDFIATTEGLINDAYEKIKGWIKAAGNMVATIIGKIVGFVWKAFTSILKIFKAIIMLPVNAIKFITEPIMEHPMQTAIMAASVLAGIPAVVGLVCRVPLPAATSMVTGYLSKITQTVASSPISKWFKVTVTEAGTKITKMVPLPKKGTPGALGWTVDGARKIFGGVLNLFSKNGPFVKAIGTLKGWASNVWQFIKKKDAAILDKIAAQKNIFGKVLGFCWKMFRDGFTTPFGLLFTCGSKFLGARKKIRDIDIEKAQEKMPTADGTKVPVPPAPEAPKDASKP